MLSELNVRPDALIELWLIFFFFCFFDNHVQYYAIRLACCHSISCFLHMYVMCNLYIYMLCIYICVCVYTLNSKDQCMDTYIGSCELCERNSFSAIAHLERDQYDASTL